MQRTQEILVDEHGLVVALFAQAQLLLEAFFLVYRVVKLAVSIRKLLAVHHEFETLGKVGIVAMFLC